MCMIVPDRHLSQLQKDAYIWAKFAIESVIPFLIIFISNMIVIRTMKSRFSDFSENPSGPNHRGQSRDFPSKANGPSRDLSVMLLAVSITFLLLTLPYVVVIIVRTAFNFTETPKKLALFRLLTKITTMLLLLNAAINFPIYFIFGSKFRNDCKILLGWKCQHITEETTKSTRVKSSSSGPTPIKSVSK